METADNDRRLSGWKDIAAFFDRSTRTVQRWEREFGLPVRRLGIGKSETVYANLTDLIAWQATAEAAAATRSSLDHSGQRNVDVGASVDLPGSSRQTSEQVRPNWPARWGWRRPVAIAGLLLLAVPVAVGLLRDDPPKGVAARWQVVADALVVSDANDHVLWSHHFPIGIDEGDYNSGVMEMAALRGELADIDGDGRTEMLFLAAPQNRTASDWRFYCFESDGRIRWRHEPNAPATFGDRRDTPPLAGNRFFLTRQPDGGPALWLVYVNGPWFPSVLYRVDGEGRVQSEFWSAGYVTTVFSTASQQRHAVLVGARNNETHGASLAILDADRPTGSAPSSDPEFRCRTCPAGAPLAFTEFPKPPSLAALGGTSPIRRIEADNPDAILVWVSHFAGYPLIKASSADAFDVIFTLDRSLKPLAMYVGDRFVEGHERLVQQGAVPRIPVERVIDELRTVRWWNGREFEQLAVPPGKVRGTIAPGR